MVLGFSSEQKASGSAHVRSRFYSNLGAINVILLSLRRDGAKAK